MVRKPRRQRHKINTKKKPEQTVGGIPFFISLCCLFLVSILNLSALPLLWDNTAYANSVFAISGLTIGIWFGYVFLHGRANVFIHEFKHALISGLVGNKATGLNIQRDTGKFSYRYTPSDAKYNALISLAPYCVPLFTVPAIAVAILFFNETHAHMALVVGVGFGCDTLVNFREVSPIQTDLTQITGGYSIAVIFVILFNLTVATFIFAWFFQETFGLRVLMANIWDFGLHLYYYLKNK